VTAQAAAAALRNYREWLPVAIVRGLRRGLRKAEALSKTRYMQRKDSRGPRIDPPNPPPGPLGIRKGNLARTVKITEIRIERRAIIGGLRAGNSQVRYAGVHEFGGNAGRMRRVRIFARPYLTPALLDPDVDIEDEVRKEIRRLAMATLRGVARVNL